MKKAFYLCFFATIGFVTFTMLSDEGIIDEWAYQLDQLSRSDIYQRGVERLKRLQHWARREVYAQPSQAPIGPDSLAPVAATTARHNIWKKRFPLTKKAQPELQLSTMMGDITVRTWNKRSIEVTIDQCLSKGAPMVPLTIRAKGDVFEVGIQKGLHLHLPTPSCGYYVTFQARVPVGTKLVMKSISGAIRAEGVKSQIKARAVSGSIQLQDTKDLDVSTTSGRIWVRQVVGDVKAKSVSGKLKFGAVNGRSIKLRSVSGAIDTKQTSAKEKLTARTISGRISISIQPGASTTLKSLSGSISIKLKDKKGVELHTSTYSGSIHSSLPSGVVTPTGFKGPIKKLHIKTMSGSISVH